MSQYDPPAYPPYPPGDGRPTGSYDPPQGVYPGPPGPYPTPSGPYPGAPPFGMPGGVPGPYGPPPRPKRIGRTVAIVVAILAVLGGGVTALVLTLGGGSKSNDGSALPSSLGGVPQATDATDTAHDTAIADNIGAENPTLRVEAAIYGSAADGDLTYMLAVTSGAINDSLVAGGTHNDQQVGDVTCGMDNGGTSDTSGDIGTSGVDCWRIGSARSVILLDLKGTTAQDFPTVASLVDQIWAQQP